MKTPPGYVALTEVVDIVGGAVFGSGWNRLADKTDPEERATLLWTDPDVDRVVTAIAEGCEGGSIVAAYHTVTGVDDLDRAVWRAPHWRNYFIAGMIDLDLALLDEQHRPHPLGYTARCEREVFVRRDSLSLFVGRLPPVADDARPRRGPKAGTSIRVVEAMRRDLQGGVLTTEALRSESEKALAVRYGGVSRDTARKARLKVLSKLQNI